MTQRVAVGPLGFFPRVNRPVFSISAVLIVGFILFGAVFTGSADTVFSTAQRGITHYFGWFLILTTNLLLLLCVYLGLGRFSNIRLGEQTDEPRYGLAAWTAMLFSAGIGIGLMYWATAEPLYHFFSPPMGEPESREAASQAMVLAFLHWGLHGWAVYIVVSLSLAYFSFRRGLPLSIRSGLYPLIGDRIYGPIGHAVDILAVFGTMFGIVTSLGLGAMQVNAGLNYLFGMPEAVWAQILIIAGITALATVSVMLGLDAGIKRISQWNLGLTILLLTFLLAVGPTLFILDSFVENIGNYLGQIVTFGFWNEAYSGTSWQESWTIFYWAWWIAWSPFVGTFIARISRGRTIGEFVLGMLVIPTAMLFFWFTAFGGTALYLELNGDPGLIEATRQNYGLAIFKLLELLPFTQLFAAITIVMIVIWFVSSSDSGSFVIDMLTAGGDPNPPKVQRVFWATTEGAVAIVLLLAGGLEALQAGAIVAGFPFAFVLLAIGYALLRGLQRDKLIKYRTKQEYRTDEEAEAAMAPETADEKD